MYAEDTELFLRERLEARSAMALNMVIQYCHSNNFLEEKNKNGVWKEKGPRRKTKSRNTRRSQVQEYN